LSAAPNERRAHAKFRRSFWLADASRLGAKRRLRTSVEARRGASFANQLRPDSGVLRRLTPRQHDDSTRRCTIILRGLTAGRHPLRHRLASPSSSPARVSSEPKDFLFLCHKLRFHRHFSHLVQRSAEVVRTAERLRVARCLRTQPVADNAVGGGAYTQN
jgi:hypothetical protein